MTTDRRRFYLRGALAAMLFNSMLAAACDPEKEPSGESGTSGKTDSTSGTSSGEEALLPACVDFANGQGGASAEEECAQWLVTACGADNELACEQIFLGSTGTDVAVLCVWLDVWRGFSENMCEEGTFGAACIGSLNVGETDPSGPFYRSLADETWIVTHDGSEKPVGYDRCNSSPSPPMSCECLESPE